MTSGTEAPDPHTRTGRDCRYTRAALAAEPDWKDGRGGARASRDECSLAASSDRVNAPDRSRRYREGRAGQGGFALGSYAAFKPVGDQAMVMGDLVLLDQEVPGSDGRPVQRRASRSPPSTTT